jgi:hypothetical protein
MPTVLTTKAVEQSTYIITASFTDAAGVAVVPNTITWTLTDAAGNIVNSREDEAVLVPAESIDILLSGDDLRCPHGRDRSLILTVKAIYDSTEGSDLPLNEQVRFTVQNLQAVL